MSDKPTTSLREKFIDACNDRRGYWKQRAQEVEKTIDGTMNDYYGRFDEIAAGLKAGLEALIEDVDNCRNLIGTSGEGYRHNMPPLRFVIALPATNNAIEPDPRNMLWDLPGYQKIHEICAGKDVDMNVVTGLELSGYEPADGGEYRGYHAVFIEISPNRRYCQPEDFRPLNPAAVPACVKPQTPKI